MTTITLQDIKTKGAKAIPDDRVSTLIVNSKPKGMFVPPDVYEMLVDALEELEDRQVIEERKNDPIVPYEEIFPKKKK